MQELKLVLQTLTEQMCAVAKLSETSFFRKILYSHILTLSSSHILTTLESLPSTRKRRFLAAGYHAYCVLQVDK